MPRTYRPGRRKGAIRPNPGQPRTSPQAPADRPLRARRPVGQARHGLLTLERGADGRQRIARLTDRARALLPLIEAEWAATDVAAAELEAELPAALTEVLQEAERAVLSRPMRGRIADAARTLAGEAAPAADPAALLAIAGETR